MDRTEQQAAGTHPAPCARHCEANAFQIEIRGLKAAYASACEAGKKLAQQALKAEQERDALAAEMKALLEQEPVGYLKKVTLGWLEKHKDTPDSYAGACILCARLDDSTAPLYTHPVSARELTDADIALCIASADKSFAQERISGKPVLGVWSKHLARAIERYLKGEGK